MGVVDIGIHISSHLKEKLAWANGFGLLVL